MPSLPPPPLRDYRRQFKCHQTKEVLFSVERRAIATTTCYDIYREGECIAKVEFYLFFYILYPLM